MSKKKPKPTSNTIALNKKSRYDYHLEERFEAGIALQGWEVKSLRAGNGQITEAYVLLKSGQAYLFGARIPPLPTVSTHHESDPTRSRKLLLHAKEIDKLVAATEAKGYTCVCTAMYWKSHLVKVEIALGKGKQQHDKRQTEKDRDWDRQKQRVLSNHSR